MLIAFLINRVWSTKHLCLKGTEYAVNSVYSCYESNCSRFWEWNYNSDRKVISSLYTTMPLLILHNNKVPPRKSQCGEDWPPYSLNLASANCSCSLKWKQPSKDKAFRTPRTSRRMYRPNEMPLLWIPLITVLCNFNKHVKCVLRSKDITLMAKFFYFMCICFYTPNARTSVWPWRLPTMHTTREGAGIRKDVKLSCILVCYIMIHI